MCLAYFIIGWLLGAALWPWLMGDEKSFMSDFDDDVDER